MTQPLISIAKGVGIFAAAAVGDALGWPQENRSQIVGGNAARNVPAEPNFRGWERNGGTQYARYTDPVAPGEYSDDTQLLLAVARACLHGDQWYDWLTRVELPIWPTFERGGGGAVLAASRAWADQRPPWVAANQRDDSKVARYFNAGANGVAMRIAPHAIHTALTSPADLMTRVVRDGLTTHGHPRALIGACLHALAIRHAIREEGTLGYGELLNAIASDNTWRHPDFLLQAIDEDWDRNYRRHSLDPHSHPADHWLTVTKEVDDLLDIAATELTRGATGNDKRALEALGCFDKTRNGSGTVTAVAAIYVASRTAARPMSGLLRTGFLPNADTDTLCSMTGSLLGAIHGPDWLGHLQHAVQDSEYITQLAVSITDAANGNRTPSRPEQAPVACTSSQLRRWSEELFKAGHAEAAPDGRPWHIRDVFELRTKSRSVVTRAIGVTHDGQTLIHDRTSKTPSPIARHAQHERTPPPQADTPKPITSPQPGRSIQPLSAEPRVATIELQVADIAASTQFFADVLGFPVDAGKDRTRVGSLLVLARRKSNASSRDDLGTVITVVAEDLDAIAARAEGFPDVRVAWAEDGSALWIKEPGLNTLRIVSERRQELNAAHHASDADFGPQATSRSTPPPPTAAESAYIQDALFDTDQPPNT